jgi:hypothetical protein
VTDVRVRARGVRNARRATVRGRDCEVWARGGDASKAPRGWTIMCVGMIVLTRLRAHERVMDGALVPFGNGVRERGEMTAGV